MVKKNNLHWRIGYRYTKFILNLHHIYEHIPPPRAAHNAVLHIFTWWWWYINLPNILAAMHSWAANSSPYISSPRLLHRIYICILATYIFHLKYFRSKIHLSFILSLYISTKQTQTFIARDQHAHTHATPNGILCYHPHAQHNNF